MDHTFPIFLPAPLWRLLCNFFGGHERLAAAVGIWPNMVEGRITETEIEAVLCGEWNVWPARLRSAYFRASVETACKAV